MSQDPSLSQPPGPTLTAASPREIADRAGRVELLARLVREVLKHSQPPLASAVQTALVALDEFCVMAKVEPGRVVQVQPAADASDGSSAAASPVQPSAMPVAAIRSPALAAQAWVSENSLS